MEEAKAKWAPFAEKYDIHEETYLLTAKLDELEEEDVLEIPLERGREQCARVDDVLQGTVEFVGKESEMTIPSPHDAKGIEVTVYKPDSCPENPTILVYFHGGGLIVGARRCMASPVKIWSMESGAIVVNVEYRLLPNKEAPYAPFDDGITATQWVLANKTTLGGTETSKVGLGGDSSGGHITACVTNEVMGLDFQILLYPVADTSLSQSSYVEHEHNPNLDMKTMKWIWKHSMDYIPNHVENPRCNPMARTNTETSPPALFVVSELDPLVGGCEDYAEKLRAAGVPVQYEVIKGVPHGIFTSRTVTKTVTARAYGLVVDFIRRFHS